MTDHEHNWDAKLHIRTVGRDDANSDQYRYPYEPTPYTVLERLADSGLIGESDTVLDYGCGKGRVGFFLAHRVRARNIGIEYDRRICEAAWENQSAAVSGKRTSFHLTRAEAYDVPADVTCCYFFNPFSAEILRKVMARILASYYETPREILLFFYYPSDAYIACLMTVDELEYFDEIECGDLFPGNDPRECIMIFRLP